VIGTGVVLVEVLRQWCCYWHAQRVERTDSNWRVCQQARAKRTQRKNYKQRSVSEHISCCTSVEPYTQHGMDRQSNQG